MAVRLPAAALSTQPSVRASGLLVGHWRRMGATAAPRLQVKDGGKGEVHIADRPADFN
jgi:hypothetical protein